MKERKEGTKDSMRQVPLYGGATMEQRPLMWFVVRFELVGIPLYVIMELLYLSNLLKALNKSLNAHSLGRIMSGNPRKIQRLAASDNREEK